MSGRSLLDWVGVAAAVVSGLVHLRLGIGFFPSGLESSFLLARLGFVVWGCALTTWRLRAQAEPGVD